MHASTHVFFCVCVCIRGPKLAWNLKDGDWTYHEALSSWQCFSLFMMYSHRCVSHAGFDFPYAAASWDYAVSRCFPFSIPSPYLYSSIVYIYITSIHAHFSCPLLVCFGLFWSYHMYLILYTHLFYTNRLPRLSLYMRWILSMTYAVAPSTFLIFPYQFQRGGRT